MPCSQLLCVSIAGLLDKLKGGDEASLTGISLGSVVFVLIILCCCLFACGRVSRAAKEREDQTKGDAARVAAHAAAGRTTPLEIIAMREKRGQQLVETARKK